MRDRSDNGGESRVYAEALRQASRDYEELVDEFSILRLLNDSLQVGLGYNEICRKLIQFLTETMNVENASVMVFDPEKDEIRLLAGKSFYEDKGSICSDGSWSGKTFKLGEGIAGQVAKERKSIRVNDTLTDSRFVSAEGQKVSVRSILSLPLAHGGHLHGVLNLSSSEPEVFTSKKEHALNIIASTASVALSQALSEENLKQSNMELTVRNRELGAVIALSESLHSNLELDPVLAESLENISDGFDIEAAAIFLEDKEAGAMRLRSYTARSKEPGVKRLLQDVSARLSEEIIGSKNNRPFVSPVEIADPSQDSEDASRNGRRTCIGVPLLSGEDCFGTLLILCASETAFEEAEINLLSSFCRQISAAIHNSILVSRLKENISELKETREKLIQSDKLALLGEMVSGVAHEINNPLAAIMGYSELLLDDGSISDNGITMLERTITCVVRCRKIVQGLLSFARKTELEKKPARINDIIDRVLAHRDYDLTVSNIEVVKDYAIEDPIAIVDPNQVEQVFLNLLNNAFDSMAGRDVPGILEIRTCLIEDNMVQIEFIDNGRGISEKDKTKLFEPFFTTKEVGKGTGLGLSVSYGIIKEHEGDLYIDDAHYCGAKFVLTLPLASTQQAAEEPFSPGASFVRTRVSGRALIVDDEDVVADVMEAALSAKGFSVDCAADGEQAYRMMKVNEYDLIVSDIRMPGAMDGRRLFFEVRKTNPELAERFVFISGDVMEKKTAEFLKESGRSYLLKPFSLNDLHQVIQKTLQQAHS